MLYFHPGPTLINNTPLGTILPGMTLAQDDLSSNTLYFKYVVQPISDFQTEPYTAGLEFKVSLRTLQVGKFNPVSSQYSIGHDESPLVDLNSANPEAGESYQYVRATDVTTIVFKVQYNAGAADNVTVWLDPDPGQSEGAQAAGLTTAFDVDASFNEIALTELDLGAPGADGWTFSDIRIATTFDEALTPLPVPVLVDAALVSGADRALENASGSLRIEEPEISGLGPAIETPEPGALWQLGSGLALLSILYRRRRDGCARSRRDPR